MTQLNELDNGPGKVKNLPKINYDKGLRPEGTMARVAKENAEHKKNLEREKAEKKVKRSIDALQKIINNKLKATITYSDYMMAWNGFPDLDPHDIISGISKRTGGSFENIQKQMDKFAKEDGYKNFMDGYLEQVKKYHEDPERFGESENLEEMAMDSISHKKFGKLGWHNEGGVHKIKRNGKTIFSGTHKEAAKHWQTIKHITESILTESTFVANYKKGSDRFQLWKSKDKHTLHKQEDGKWVVHSKHNGSSEDVHSGLKADGFRKTKDLKEDEDFLESDKNKLRTLAHNSPEAADAAALVIREYMDNPKKQFSQIVAKVVEETGITKSQLMKVVDELGISFE